MSTNRSETLAAYRRTARLYARAALLNDAFTVPEVSSEGSAPLKVVLELEGLLLHICNTGTSFCSSSDADRRLSTVYSCNAILPETYGRICDPLPRPGEDPTRIFPMRSGGKPSDGNGYRFPAFRAHI